MSMSDMLAEPITLSTMGDGNGFDESFGEKVVITGMSGLFPQSLNVKELSNILYNKINPVNSENRNWQSDHPEVSPYLGKVPGLKEFDGQFFKVHYRLGNNMDSMSRKVLEHTFQAIYDAGVSVSDLSGRKVGVYMGSSFAETEKLYAYTISSSSGQGMTGCSKSMFANRISYWLNVTGPSMNIDEAGSSSMGALELAYWSIKRGECEAAIVTGAHLSLHPQSSIHYGRLIKISTDGKTRSFDAQAEGCANSEAINVLFLQKAKNALRMYAEVVHVKCDFISMLRDELGPKYGFYRDPEIMANFISNFYKEAKVSPEAVEYVEAFGSATPEADKAELDAIDKVFCVNNNKQLLVGSVMSNIGYTEAASGIAAITKVLLGYHHGRLAGNLHCESPRKDIDGLREGRMRILTDHQTFGRTYTAVNGLSVTGINSHALLNAWYKRKDTIRYKSNIPRLVTISGRQESAVNTILQDLKCRPIDAEEIALFHNIHKSSISGHLGRGFIILDTNEKNETVSLSEQASYFNDAKRPLWFVYSGMGSQWAGMGVQLMRIPVFAAAIERCRKVLEPKGVDIVQIITSPDTATFKNILNSFVGIAAIQIGLTDVLSAMEIFPDKIIGHSAGELGCAYADGCLTAEEMILSAYSRGLVSVQTPFIRGSMAAVGIGFRQISKICPPEIEVACHNGPDSSTISGPADIMKEFVAQLTAKDIFAKEVPCSNIAYHSRYIACAGPGLFKYLGEVIKTPKVRSQRWVSTSVPLDRWHEPIAKYSSAEYHTNNLLNPVLFEEVSQLISANAVLVEIAPHGLLQAILKRSLPDSCKHIPLTKRNHHDNALFLLQAVGNLYLEGYNPKVQALYPKVEYPVSTGTPMLSHLIEWAHNENWALPLYVRANRKTTARCTHAISVHDDDYGYLKGHVIQGRNIHPFAATLVMVWDTLAMVLGLPKKNLSVEFRDIHLHSQPVLHDQKPLRLSVDIHRGKGRFEVLNENINVASGFITKLTKKELSQKGGDLEEILELKSEDIYKLLKYTGYNYENDFRSIHEANMSLTKANLVWQNNWVTLIDGMLQINALRQINGSILQTRYIESLQIDVEEHLKNELLEKDKSILLPAKVSRTKNNVKCGGVHIENIKLCGFPSISREEIALKTLKFVPYVTSNTIDATSALYVLLQVVAQNINNHEINVLELIDDKNLGNFQNIQEIITDIPEVKINFTQIHRRDIVNEKIKFVRHVDLLMTNNLANDDDMCQLLLRVVKRNTFVINKAISEKSDMHPSQQCRKVCSHSFGSTRLDLLVWLSSDALIYNSTSSITLFSQADIDKLFVQLPKFPTEHRITIITSYSMFTGLKDLIKEKRVKDNRKINLVIANDKLSSKQDLDPIPFPDLTISILNNGIWGGEYYLPLKENIIKEQQMALELTRSGDNNSLRWIVGTQVNYPGISIKVQYIELNDAYAKQISGVAVSENNNKDLIEYGFSGTTDSNLRVMGIVRENSIRTHLKAKPELLWPVPEHWTLEDAATVPLAYSLALYCLCFKSRLYHGNSILVHGGTGALGQALISIALAHGCDIYTTVSNYKKKRFLLKLFPELEDDHIGNSRDGSFVDMVLSGTNGRGCDIVITCVKQNLRSDSIKCCAPLGFVIDTALVMETGDYAFEMYDLQRMIIFTNQQFSSLFEPRNASELKRLQLMMSEGIARGFVRPLSRVVFAPEDAGRAFRLQASSMHLGRVLVNLQEEISGIQIRINCSYDGLQLLLTDDEILGVQLAERLISRGAKKLDLHFNFNKSQSVLFKLRSWEKQGIQCTVSFGSTWNKTNNNLINNKTQQNVEGIYYIITSNTDCDFPKFLEYLTSMSRGSNLNMRYFAVIDARKDVNDIIKLNQSQQSITTIKLLPLKNSETGELKEYYTKDTADAIERALCSNQSTLTAYIRNQFHGNLIGEIASIAGIPNPSAMSQNIKLKDLVMDVSKLQAVQIYMQDEYNISLDLSAIELLTTKTIREIQKRINQNDFTEIDCLKTFFSSIEQDELLATTEMVFLPTLMTSSANRDDEFDISDTFLCILPGVDGLHLRFHTLCEGLKLPAMVLQPGFERPNETIQELAQRCAQILLKKGHLKTQYYLLGYESGVLVSLEIAAILEEHGLTGTIFCIGGGPDEIQVTFEKELCKFQTEQSLQIAVARHMLSLLSNHNINVDNLVDDLNKISTWKQKVSVCVEKLPGNIGHSIQYAEQVIEAAYERMLQVRRYNSKLGVLRSRIISIRASTVPNKLKSHLSLQSHSQQEVVEYELLTPLPNVTQDLRCNAIINRHLGDDVLKNFGNKNLCDTDLTNIESFITWDDMVE